jgi:hypothetical protein
MRTYIMALGVDVWDVVETGYTKPVVLASKDDQFPSQQIIRPCDYSAIKS